MSSNYQMPSANTILSSVASLAATGMLIRTIARDNIPYEFQDYIFSKIHNLFSTFSSQITIVIEEFDGLTTNQLFESIELYLGTKISPCTRRFRATIPEKESKLLLTMDKNQEIIDIFHGVKLIWRRVSKEVEGRYQIRHGDYHNPTMSSEIRYFELSFHRKYKDMVVGTYFPYIRNESLKVKEDNKTLKLHTQRYNRMYMGDGHPWQSVNLDHPATFDTLGMDIELKRMITEDLDRFVKRKEFYRKVGKAWKRGYLLFGPPGTGKSSLIAAIANYLNFDIYDLELTSVSSNSDLRKLLITTGNKSLLVVEDIDCSIDLEDRKKEARAANSWSNNCDEVTLSGLLNFVDGIWSSCGNERFIIFTTNHKEKLDPAMLRPGRMDMHIHMSYCTPCGFKMLACNYLGLTQHPLFEKVDRLIDKVKATPAEVAEQLMKSENPEAALRGLINFLQGKTIEELDRGVEGAEKSQNEFAQIMGSAETNDKRA